MAGSVVGIFPEILVTDEYTRLDFVAELLESVSTCFSPGRRKDFAPDDWRAYRLEILRQTWLFNHFGEIPQDRPPIIGNKTPRIEHRSDCFDKFFAPDTVVFVQCVRSLSKVMASIYSLTNLEMNQWDGDRLETYLVESFERVEGLRNDGYDVVRFNTDIVSRPGEYRIFLEQMAAKMGLELPRNIEKKITKFEPRNTFENVAERISLPDTSSKRDPSEFVERLSRNERYRRFAEEYGLDDRSLFETSQEAGGSG